MRKFTTIGLSVAVLAATGWLAQASAQATAPDTTAPAASSDASTPAPAPKAKHHHSMKSAKAAKPEAGDAAVDDLNAKSLSAAKSGTAFTPPPAADASKPAAKTASKPKSTHHMHKKAAAKPADAPAPDASK